MHFQLALGGVVREQREKVGLTQEELGERAGYQKGAGVSISRVESGRTMPSEERLAGIAAVLGLTAADLTSEATDRAAEQESRSSDHDQSSARSPKERLRQAEEGLNQRIATVQERGDAYYRAQADARGEVQPTEVGFFLPFAATADRIDRAVPSELSAADLLTGAETELGTGDAGQRIRLTRHGISRALLGGAGGIATGAGVGGAAAFGTFTAMATWGSASTGALISGLSGAAATNATLAALGGGALAAGGAGVLGGTLVLAGIVAAPALLLGGAGFAVAYRRRQRQMSDAADTVERTLQRQQPGYEALINYLTTATEILEYIHIHATHALRRWQGQLLEKTHEDGRISWADLSEGEQGRYQDFLTIAACQMSVVGINPEAFLAAPESEPEAGATAEAMENSAITSLDELRTFSEQTLSLAKATVESLV